MGDLKSVFESITLVHGAFILAAGVVNLWLWRRHKFWVPRYVHVLAAFAALLGALMAWLEYSSGGPRVGRYLMVIALLPTIVYLVFVFYGGVPAALNGRNAKPPEDDRRSGI